MQETAIEDDRVGSGVLPEMTFKNTKAGREVVAFVVTESGAVNGRGQFSNPPNVS